MPNETDIRVTLRNKGYIRQSDGSYSLVAARPCPAEPKPDAVAYPLAATQIQAEVPGRRTIRFTAFRIRLTDPDNNVFKWECDALRYAGIIEDDTTEYVEIITNQIKVKTKAEEGTMIEITSQNGRVK